MSDELLGYIIIISIVYIICKVRPKINNSGQSKQHKSSGQRGYYVKGHWHRSGTVHTYYPDALKEANEMKQKYPEDVFFVYETEF